MEEIREFQIWSEGYSITGQDSGAFFHGTFFGTSFEDSCIRFFKNNKDFDKKSMSYWGCKLFDNEQMARKSFG